MASRIAAAARLAIPLLPLILGLVAASYVAAATLSWGRSFPLWQLVWWSLASIILGVVTFHVARFSTPIVSRNPPIIEPFHFPTISTMAELLAVIAVSFEIVAFVVILKTSNAATAPIPLYWPLPIAAYIVGALRRLSPELRRAKLEHDQSTKESQRQERCAGVTPSQRAEYEAELLTELRSLSKPNERSVSLDLIMFRMNDECGKELVADALKTWEERGCIEVHKDEPWRVTLSLTRVGLELCAMAAKDGMQAALRQRERQLREETDRENRCQEVADTQQTEYADQFLDALGTVSGGSTKEVELDAVLTYLNHECSRELLDQALGLWEKRGCIRLSRTNRYVDVFGFSEYQLIRMVELTTTGLALCEEAKALGSMQAARREHARRGREERERKERCRQLTPLQRLEFEYEFLMALYSATAGDMRKIDRNIVLSQVKNECAPELAAHAMTVWKSQGDIWAETLKTEYSWSNPKVSLTVAGRNLCMRAEELGSLQAALSERKQRKERYPVKHEYNVYGQAGAVGPNAMVLGSEFQQFIDTTDETRLRELADELAALRLELQRTATTSEEGMAIGAVAAAEVAARRNDKEGVWRHLSQVGKWTLDTATQIGTSVATGAIKSVFKDYNIPTS